MEATNNSVSNDSPTLLNNSPFTYYGFAWKKLWKYFLELLLVTIVSIVVLLPTIGLDEESANFIGHKFVSINLIFITFEGFGAYVVFAVAYMLLLQWPLEYGISYISLLAVRDTKFHVTDMFAVFKNYWNAVLANLLVATIIGFGLMLLVIPGLIFACKLAFVPYLIVDKKMDAVEAVKMSWDMTSGYTWVIFMIGFFAFFLLIFGLAAFIVGIFISIIWIRVTFAAAYYNASREREMILAIGKESIQ